MFDVPLDTKMGDFIAVFPSQSNALMVFDGTKPSTTEIRHGQACRTVTQIKHKG